MKLYYAKTPYEGASRRFYDPHREEFERLFSEPWLIDVSDVEFDLAETPDGKVVAVPKGQGTAPGAPAKRDGGG